jgi:MazG family protein
MDKQKFSHAIEKLIWVMAQLRNPDGGCPWDLEQDFKSIAPYTIEEAYEVADAIERGNMDDLCEELGDLLLQPIYHAQMASESGTFTIHDVIDGITEKMIFRHPHVFGDAKAASAQDVNAIWDERKAAKKAQNAHTDTNQQPSALDGVTLGLPALLRAQKLQKKAAKTGFEWTDPADILDKLEEEIAEMRAALANNDLDNQEEELGDILFVLVNLARSQGIKAEDALRRTNDKFISRFKGMEEDHRATHEGSFSDASLDQMTQLWNDQKTKERA